MKKRTNKNQRTKHKKGNWTIFVILCNALLISGFFLYKNIPFSIWKIFFLIFLISAFVFLNTSLINFKLKDKDIGKGLSYFILFFLTSTYIVIYSYLSIIQYNALFTGHADLAAFDQVIWNTIHGRPFHTTMYDYNFLGEHFSPLLIILAPFYFIWEDPRMLLILQSLFLGLGAIPVYLTAKDKLKHNLLSLSFSFAWLFHPFLSRVNLFEFHEVCLSPFFLLFTFYFLQRKRWWLYSIFLFLSLMVKEDISLIITALGIYAFFKVNRKAGIITFLIGISWVYLCVKVLIPYIRVATGSGVSEATYGHFGRLGLGETPAEIIKNLIAKPQNTLNKLFLPANDKIATIILLTLPLGLLSLLSLEILIALPEIILHFMASWAAQYLLAFHYSTPIPPFAIIGGIYGCSFLLNKKLTFAKDLSIGFAFYILTSSFLSNYYFSTRAFNPTFSSSYNLGDYRTIWSFPSKELLKKYYTTKRERQIFETLKEIIPKNRILSVQDNLLSHFSQRNVLICGFPKGFKEADYVLLNNYGFNEGWFVVWAGPENCKEPAENLFKNPEFQIFFKYEWVNGGIFLFGKKFYREEMIKNAKGLVKSYPSLPEAHFILGSIYFHINNLKEAGKEFEISLRLDKDNPFAKEMLEVTEQKISLDKN